MRRARPRPVPGNRRRVGAVTIWLLAMAVSTAAVAEWDLGAAGSAYYHYSLAQQERFQRNYLDAVTHLKSAVTYDPESVDLRLEIARLYWLLGNRVNGFERNAIAQGEEAVRLAPDSLDAHQFLASAYTTLAARNRGNGDALERAIAHHETALDLALETEGSNERLSLGKLYLQVGRYQDSAGALEDYLSENPDSVEALFWLSRAYTDLGRLDDAVRPLRHALDLSPRSFNLSEAMVGLQERRGDVGAAMAAARHLLDLAPDSVVHYLRLAGLYRVDGHPLQALELYDQAERLLAERSEEPSDVALADLRLGRIEALVEADRGQEALLRVDAASDRFPQDLRFPLIRGQLRYRLGDLDGGKRALQQLLEDHRGDEALQRAVSSGVLSLADRELQADRLEVCEELLEWAVEIDPENHRALNYLGYLWADQGKNLERSLRYIQRALRIGGENGAYLDSLGWAYYRQERYTPAEEHLVRAAALSEGEPEILDHLGDLYHATGRLQKAVESWQRAIDSGATDADAIRSKIDAAREGVEPPL